MNERLRFAEAVCEGHPDRLADAIADRIVALSVARDPDALVGVEVALHRDVVFVDGRIACGIGVPFLQESDVEEAVREVYAQLSSQGIKTQFVGYEHLETKGKITAIIRAGHQGNGYLREMDPFQEAGSAGN